MKQILIIITAITAITLLTSCKKGLVFDKEMVIGQWKSWELYDYPNVWYWRFTEDSVFIYRNAINVSDSLIYEQADWNTGTFDINLFENVDPVDSVGTFNAYIDIAKYHRSYLVIKSENSNYSFSLSRL